MEVTPPKIAPKREERAGIWDFAGGHDVTLRGPGFVLEGLSAPRATAARVVAATADGAIVAACGRDGLFARASAWDAQTGRLLFSDTAPVSTFVSPARVCTVAVAQLQSMAEWFPSLTRAPHTW